MNWLIPSLGTFLIVLIFMPSLIKFFKAKHEGQVIRPDGPTWQKEKNGTPTMGGLLFIIAIVLVCALYGFLVGALQSPLIILLFVLVFYGLIGMWDDSIKLFKRQNEGFKAWQKFTLQVIGALVFAWVYIADGFPLALHLFGYSINLGYFFILFIVFWLAGFSNAVNLTDGLDGLVSGLCIIAFGAYAVVAYIQRQYDVQIFCMAVVGGLLAFLIFNKKPAKIFMGDMGSLALGGALAAVSILLHHELSLLWIGLVFVIETASVILQVASFKLFHKRIFKMTPIHHSFEMMGWSEWKIDLYFWLIGLICAVTGVLFIIYA